MKPAKGKQDMENTYRLWDTDFEEVVSGHATECEAIEVGHRLITAGERDSLQVQHLDDGEWRETADLNSTGVF